MLITPKSMIVKKEMLTIPKSMFLKNKCQPYEQENESLLKRNIYE